MKKVCKIFVSAILSMLIFVAGCAPSVNDMDIPPSDTEEEKKPDTAFTETVMAQNGETDYKIVVPENAGECILYAASELNKYFCESTGATMEIVNDSDITYTVGSKLISLGDTKLASDISVTKEEVNMDGYKIIRREDAMFIKAYNDRGVLYGVYEFLNRAFDYECYAIDEIALTKKDTAYLPDLSFTDAPSFEGRFLDGPLDYNLQLQAMLRMKNNTLTLEKYGEGANKEWMGMHCESFLHIVDYEDYENYYAEHHPEIDPKDYKYEWFSNATGTSLQWCLTNKELLDVVVENLKKIILDHPEGIYVNISEEDMGTFCSCDRTADSYCGMSCSESRNKYGMGGTLIRFLNQVIERLEKWREEVCPERELKYVTFVYHATMIAPVTVDENNEYVPIDDTVIPHEKLYVRYAPITRCYSHDLCDPTCKMNKSFGENYAKWCSITDNMMVWEYRVNYSHYFLFFNNYSTLQDEYIRYYENGCINMMAEYATGGTLASMCDLNVYLNSKLQWNVYADQNKLIDDFMNAYYKDGAVYMKEYLNLMRTHLASVEEDRKAKGEEFHFGMYATNTPYTATAETWPVSVLEKAMELLDKASAEYDKIEDSELREKMKTRVLRESICVRYIILNNYESYYNIYTPEYVEAVDEWENDLKSISVYVCSEGGAVSSFVQKLRSKGLG